MVPRMPALALLLAMAACGTLESSPVSTNRPLRGPVTALGDTDWRLVAVNGEKARSDTVIVKIAGGFISGQAPCNVINGNYVGTLPSFEVETMVSTKIACDLLGLEHRIIEGFMNARQASIANNRLTISGIDAPTLVFEPA